MNIKTERQLNKAKKLAKKGEYKKASEILSKIIKILPENKVVSIKGVAKTAAVTKVFTMDINFKYRNVPARRSSTT